jgi:hypothetical protein
LNSARRTRVQKGFRLVVMAALSPHAGGGGILPMLGAVGAEMGADLAAHGVPWPARIKAYGRKTISSIDLLLSGTGIRDAGFPCMPCRGSAIRIRLGSSCQTLCFARGLLWCSGGQWPTRWDQRLQPSTPNGFTSVPPWRSGEWSARWHCIGLSTPQFR